MIRQARHIGSRRGADRLVSTPDGNTSNIKWFAGIGELKINHGPGYRIYLAREGNDLIVLLGGGTKQRQQHDISRAKRLHEEYKQRKRNE